MASWHPAGHVGQRQLEASGSRPRLFGRDEVFCVFNVHSFNVHPFHPWNWFHDVIWLEMPAREDCPAGLGHYKQRKPQTVPVVRHATGRETGGVGASGPGSPSRVGVTDAPPFLSPSPRAQRWGHKWLLRPQQGEKGCAGSRLPSASSGPGSGRTFGSGVWGGGPSEPGFDPTHHSLNRYKVGRRRQCKTACSCPPCEHRVMGA